MLCNFCKKSEAKHPGKTCSLKCATEAHNALKGGDSYLVIKRRLDIEIANSRLMRGFSGNHGRVVRVNFFKILSGSKYCWRVSLKQIKRWHTPSTYNRLSVINKITAQIVITDTALLVTVDRVKSQIRSCSNSLVVPRMPLPMPVVRLVTRYTRKVRIPKPDKLVKRLLSLLFPVRCIVIQKLIFHRLGFPVEILRSQPLGVIQNTSWVSTARCYFQRIGYAPGCEIFAAYWAWPGLRDSIHSKSSGVSRSIFLHLSRSQRAVPPSA